MKKIIIFLILIILVQNPILEVHAKSSKFYEGEYIDGIWMNKAPGRGSNVTYYQKARFFRQIGTNDFAYCMEPFKFFEASGDYESTVNPNSLTEGQKNKISELAHFGYGYPGHTSEKWYAITQFMIWEAADPNGDYYFTDSLNGNRITRFQEEMNEINNLMNNYHTNPSMSNQTYQIVENETLYLTDTNNVLSHYQSNNPNIVITNNQLIIKNLPAGEHTIILERQDNLYNKPIIFYQSSTSQDLVETGNLEKKEIHFKVNTQTTEIKVHKIDYDTNSTIASGDAILQGAIYQIYDQNMNPITTLKIDENFEGMIKNLFYGKYYIKEIKAGMGYDLDPNIYDFELTKDHPTLELTLANKVIKSKIEIHKTYGENNNLQQESNIQFNIYYKDKLIATITTNEQGYAEIFLPYGTYQIEQVNTTPGYQKVKSWELTVENNKPLQYHLVNYKIPVPNTKTSLIETLFSIIENIIKGILQHEKIS